MWDMSAPHKKDEDLKSDSKKAPGQKKGNVSSTEIPKSKENLSKPKFSQLPSKSSTMKMSEAVKVQKSGSKAEKLKSVSPATLPKSVSKSDVTFTVKSGDGTPFSQAKDTEHGQARCNPVATNTNYKPSTVLKPAACKTSEHFSSMIRKVRSAPDLKTVQKDQEIESGEKVLTPAKAESPETKKVVLPKVTLDSMSKSELKEFIPRLLKLVTGRATVFHSRRSAKPEWWPEDVPWVNSYSDWFSKSYWADHLKMVVMNCYRYLGQENFLYASGDPRIQQARMSTDEWCDDEDMVNTGSYPSTPVKINMKDRMHNHQRQCPMRPPELCGFRSEQAAFSRFDENLINPKKSQDIPEQKWSNLPKEKFLPAINLICKTDAAAYMKRRPSAEIDCDIELDGVETKPLSPVHLNSPTTLMSQLSKDESGSARKRLSYSFSVDKDNTNIVDLGSSEDSDDDEQNSDKERKEFFTKVNYGISLKSYQLLKKMKNVRVKLPKLSRKAFLRWMSRRKLDRALKGKFKGLKVGGCSLDEEFSTSDCEFPSGPCLLAPNIDKLLGLKKKSSQKSASALSLTNCVSEELEAEVSKQKLTLYRSLLYEMSVVKATVVMEDISGPAEGQIL
ncbi:NRF1-like protein [Mya arenaria]|uniref:NRF1-like protein n=1 Tax=Mya arenaria TaxID=6604 RepID=A0ABY7FZY4_MYAAR|nr:NRF1-like protein [Mya arenaria]